MSYANYATTGLQEEVGKALDAGENLGKWALARNMDSSIARKIARKLKARAAKKDRKEHIDNTPDGFGITRTSTNYNQDGEVNQQWVIRTPDAERQLELMREMVEALSKEIKPCKPIKPPQKALLSDIMTHYTLTDCHVGALAWHKEGGADWNLTIAEDVLVGCFAKLMDKAPDSETAIVAELGDFEHFDSFSPVTPTHGHILDASARLPEIIETSIRIRRRLVEMALKKHKTVYLVIAEGNHNMSSSVWARKMFAALYDNEPRVKVIDTELPYYCHVFGNVMIGFHHGHIRKPSELPMVFASIFPDDWHAKSRHFHCGHRHHLDIKEYSGGYVYQHPTLAARDAHASRGAYLSHRKAIGITYHREEGMMDLFQVAPDIF